MRDRSDLLRGSGRRLCLRLSGRRRQSRSVTWLPLLGAPLLADSSAEAIDGSTLSFLLQRTLEVKRKEEEAVEAAELVELEEKLAAAEGRLLEVLRREREEATRVTRQTWSTLSRVDQLAVHWFLAKEVVVKRREKRKKTQEEMAGGRYFYGPLYLAVACSTLFVPEEHSYAVFLGDDFRICGIQLPYLVRQWIRIYVSLRRPGGLHAFRVKVDLGS